MQETNALTQLLVKLTCVLKIGHLIGHRNLTLAPLFGASPAVDYLLGQDAIEDGLLTVKEVSDSGIVNVLLVENKAGKPVLLLDGEELVGAKQNRILNTTILIDARTTQKIPVSCVEQGRWRHASEKFSVGTYAPPEMRNRKCKRVSASYRECGQPLSDQGEVWQDVERVVSSMKAKTATRAMKDAFDQRAADLGGFVKALPYPDGARGVIAAVSGHFAAMDVLDKPETFQRVWNRLLGGYAVDAVRLREWDNKPFSEKSAQFILDSMAECRVSEFKAVGLGNELRFESNLMVGQALVADDMLIHLSIFPNASDSRNEQSEGRPIMPPSLRRRWRRPQGEE